MLSLTDFSVTFFFFFVVSSIPSCSSLVRLCLIHKPTFNWVVIFVVFGALAVAPGSYSMAIVKGNKIAFSIFVILLVNQYTPELKAHSISARESALHRMCIIIIFIIIIIHSHSHWVVCRGRRLGELADMTTRNRPSVAWTVNALFPCDAKTLSQRLNRLRHPMAMCHRQVEHSSGIGQWKEIGEKVFASDETPMNYVDANQYEV